MSAPSSRPTIDAAFSTVENEAPLRWLRRLHLAQGEGLVAGQRALGSALLTWLPIKARIVAFVQPVTEHGGKDFVAVSERIAVFDNDGTLWAEQPVCFQAPFMAPTHESTVYPTLECA